MPIAKVATLVFDFNRAVDRARAFAGERDLARSGYGHRGAFLQVGWSSGNVPHIASPIARPAFRAGTRNDGVGVDVERLWMAPAVRFRVGFNRTVASGRGCATPGDEGKCTSNGQKATNSTVHRISQ